MALEPILTEQQYDNYGEDNGEIADIIKASLNILRKSYQRKLPDYAAIIGDNWYAPTNFEMTQNGVALTTPYITFFDGDLAPNGFISFDELFRQLMLEVKYRHFVAVPLSAQRLDEMKSRVNGIVTSENDEWYVLVRDSGITAIVMKSQLH